MTQPTISPADWDQAAAEVWALAEETLPPDGLRPGEALPLILTPQGPVHYSPLPWPAAADLLSGLLHDKPHLRGFAVAAPAGRLELYAHDRRRQALELIVRLPQPPPPGPRTRLSPLAARSLSPLTQPATCAGD